MEKLKLEVVTPVRVVVRREVDVVVAPGTEGELGVLAGHAAFLTGIVPGELRFGAGSERESLAVTTGFLEVFDNKVSVLVDAAERAGEIDIQRARRAAERARGRLAQDARKDNIDLLRAESALKRALNRIRTAEKGK